MITRQAAFGSDLPVLRGCLHSHTTRSDGMREPAELLRAFAAKGYDFAAITDHDRYNYTNYAPETGILVVPGMETEGNITVKEGVKSVHTFHQVGLGRPYQKGLSFEQDEHFPYAQVTDQSEFTPRVQELQRRGNLTFYCHPQWSGTPVREFELIPGNFALEIWNSGCAVDNDMDTNNTLYWDELLCRGKRIYAVATDDCHKPGHEGLGWVMVRAEKTLDGVLDALQNGAFYASCGPEIHDFYVEDGVARVTCSPCQSITLRFERWPSHHVRGEGIRETQSSLPQGAGYVRAECVDVQGRRAWSNPIFL